MDLKKRVIESTIMAVMLMIVTAVTAVVSPAPVTETLTEEQKSVAGTSDGTAGIIDELAISKQAAEENATVSVVKADLNTVAESAEPELTEEQKNAISHRGKALRAMKTLLHQYGF